MSQQQEQEQTDQEEHNELDNNNNINTQQPITEMNDNDNDNEREEEEQEEEEQEEEDEDEEVVSRFSWSNLSLKQKICVIFAFISLCYIGYSISMILSLTLSFILISAVFFTWFSSTNLSVEITVFLAQFFPPSIKPVWDCRTTPECAWSKAFRENYKVIYNEYLEFEKKYNYCPQMDDVYPNGSITNWDRKWPTVNLRCYGLDTEISKYFPKTMKLVNDSDTWLSHVMFSILKPNKFIPRHRGPYRGVFRYHLHLEIPEYKDHTKELYLAVWDKTSSAEFWSPENVPSSEPTLLKWNNGDDFLFDDTCVHEVINFTKKRRIILFMDVERHDITFFAKCIHRLFMNLAKYLPAVKTMREVQDGYLKRCIDEETKQPTRFRSKLQTSASNQVDMDNELFMSNSWMWYNAAPEILPYKRARIVIRKSQINNHYNNISHDHQS